MTEPPFDEHGDRLRRALQAEAEAVTADPDGLERIRARINKRERQFGWLTVPWLRPLAAAGAAVFIAAAAVTATPAIEGIVSTGHDSPSAQGGNDQSLAMNGPGASNRPGLPLSTTIGPDGIPRTAAPGPSQGVPVRGNCPAGQVQIMVPARIPKVGPSGWPSTSVCKPAPASPTPPAEVSTPPVTPPPPSSPPPSTPPSVAATP
jgi:hypothetical protein